MSHENKRVGLIACEIFFREIAYYLARSPRVFDVVFLPKGLHDLGGEKMRGIIQAEIDKMQDKDYSHIVLAYALCNNGLVDVCARHVPLVIPRAHDCITLFLGSRQRYHEYFHANPGTYFHTTGWLERGAGDDQHFDSELGPAQTLEDLIEKYGEDNARYLKETLDPLKNYHKIAYIQLPIDALPDLRVVSKQAADDTQWEWEEIEGDPGLLERLLNGPHGQEEFLVLRPGEKVAASVDEAVIAATPSDDGDGPALD